jgi:lambda repressor-like predicted transcriptional regulator
MEKESNNSWKWLKHRLDLQGLTFNELARIHNVDRTCFTGVKNKPIPKYERILADYAGCEPWTIWPDRYDATHNPNRISSRYQGHKSLLEQSSKKVNRKRESRR